MTKKDYILLAKALQETKPRTTKDEELAMLEWELIVVKMRVMLKNDNPHFNHAKFLQACGYHE